MTYENTVSIGGYFGIKRETIYNPPLEVIVRFYPLENYDVDVEFGKIYENKEDALASLKKFNDDTALATPEETRPLDSDWPAFGKKVNLSIIKLYRDVIDDKILLPDYGFGYSLRRRNIDELKYWIEESDKGRNINFVSYSL